MVIHKWLTFLWIFLLITGCESLPTFDSSTYNGAVTPTKQLTISPTALSTKQPKATLTHEVNHTLEPTLIELSGECLLPCWWNITPGITAWDTALKILNQIDGNFKGITVSDDSIKVEVFDDSYVGFRRNGNGIIERIILSNIRSKGVEYYDVLTEYGEPSEIYIFTWKNFQTRPPWLGKGERPVLVILYYEGKGILAEYEFFGTFDDTTSIITVCPNITEQTLRLYPDSTKFTQSIIGQTISGGEEIPILKIDETRSLGKHDFYMRYKDKNQTGCFETPASLWY